MKNKDLKRSYDQVYRGDERKHYTPLLLSGDKVPPAKIEVLKEISWKGKTVLDAGCGTGELAYLIAKREAARVVGVDYSKEAIDTAKKTYVLPNLEFVQKDIGVITGKFDVVASLGTLEHLDDPLRALRKLKSLLHSGGSLIITCPNWTNTRGYILQTLRMLFDAKITLFDIHYFSPLEFQEFAKKLRMDLVWRTVDHNWADGEKMIADFMRRLPKVLLADKRFKTNQKKIDTFIEWLSSHTVFLERPQRHTGAVGLYHFRKLS